MLRLAVLGAGNHSRANHLPALSRYVSEHPGAIELAALCDLDRALAERMAAAHGFARVYTDLGQMLAEERLDGLFAVTPIPATAQVAVQAMEAGLPLLVEKPLGGSMADADRIMEAAERTKATVMVSVNRRFSPALRAGLAWWGDAPAEFIRASMWRTRRREPEFVTGTGIHPVDAIRHIAGEVSDVEMEARRVDGVWWYYIRLQFQSGARGLVELMPTAGLRHESYEIFGAERRLLVEEAEYASGVARGWEGGNLLLDTDPAAGQPAYVRNGAYAEACEFIAALQEGRQPYPSLVEVYPSMELVHGVYARIAA
ncbi:MAG: Gfo/Idh/MocA family oxidoreductase [Chloroflexi bacterium]|nr:Gfo/Idh/MocA family oxidoreductase [Chloroflexota bacterium]